jgi:hypothetical protein
MLSFELWFFYFSKLVQFRIELQSDLSFFLQLRTVFAVSNSVGKLEFLENMLVRYLRVFSEDILKSKFGVLERRIRETVNQPLVPYLESLELLPFPALVRIDLSFGKEIKFAAVIARSFGSIEIIENGLLERDTEALEIWDSIRSNIKVFIKDEGKIEKLDLPNCQELYIYSTDIDEIATPRLLKLELETEYMERIPKNILNPPSLRKAVFSDPLEFEFMQKVLRNTQISNLSIVVPAQASVDFSRMQNLRKLKLNISGDFEEDSELPYQLPPDLTKLTIRNRNYRGEQVIVLRIPAVSRVVLEADILRNKIEIVPRGPFSRIDVLKFKNTSTRIPVLIEKSLNPKIVLERNYIECIHFDPFSGKSFPYPQNRIQKIKNFEEINFEDIDLSSLEVLATSISGKDDIPANLSQSYYDIEEFRERDWRDLPSVKIKPRVRKLIFNNIDTSANIDIRKMASLIMACPALEDIVIKTISEKDRKITEFLLLQLNRDVRVRSKALFPSLSI